MNEQTVSAFLKRVYSTQLLIAVVLAGIAYLLNYFSLTSFTLNVSEKTVSVVLASLAGAFGIAFPVFYRSYFIYGLKNKNRISNKRFMNFEKKILNIALTAPYFLVFSIMMNLPENTHILITLFSLYATYYYFPSDKKVRFEMKVFRINAELD